MKRGAQRSDRHALDLLEEAVHLLRLSPLAVMATYYLGSVPFVLGFLFFWTEMSKSAFAHHRITSSALVLGLLFLWMKVFQSLFAQQLLTRISGHPSRRWSWRGVVRAAAAQIILQPWGLFLLPAALIATLPFGWVYAFYQNVTVLGSGDRDSKGLRQEAFRQAQIWPGQNHLVLAFVSLGALFVLLNLGLACSMIPQCLKMFFGIESVFTRHASGMLNSTFVLAMAGLTYLCIDPLVKAVYALRCFYAQAIESGEDLKVQLRSLPGWNVANQESA
jgi:hypothetical protein